MTTEDAKSYLSAREIPRLFESLMTGLMFHRPNNHIAFLKDCLDKIKGDDTVTWNMFVDYKLVKSPLPPISPDNGNRHPACKDHDDILSNRSTPLPPISSSERIITSASLPSLSNVPIVLVMGGPGSSKIKQINTILAEHSEWVHISIGDLLRNEVLRSATSSEKWRAIGDMIMKGEMAPKKEAFDLFYSQMERNKDAAGFIIEGYPRNNRQLDDYNRAVRRVDLVLLIDCEEDTLTNRLNKRRSNSIRPDDAEEAALKRVKYFKEKTLPLIKHFDDLGRLRIFRGEQDEDVLNSKVLSAFDKVLYKENLPSPPSPALERGSVSSLAKDGLEPIAVTSEEHAMDEDESMGIIVAKPAEVNVVDTGRLKDMPGCPIIFIAGGPGSGKAAQCKKIAENYKGLVHLSMGDLIRTEISTKGTADEKWDMIRTLIEKGEMAPEDETIELLVSNLKEHLDASAIVIEGYPRNARQVEEFNTQVGGVSFVILLDCEKSFLQQRIIKRSSTSGRLDDTTASMEQRILFFRNSTLPVLKHYDDDGKLVVLVGDRDENEIYRDICKTLDFALYGRKSEAPQPVANDSSANDSQDE